MLIDPTDQSRITTIERHILEQQRHHPEATGVLTQLLYDIALCGKIIASRTTRAGLVEILGRTGEVNVQGESVQILDRFADSTFLRINDHTGRLAIMASEEHEGPLSIPSRYPTGKYVLVFDPLDGSSNIDFNIPIGTIFGIYKRISESGPGTLQDVLQAGHRLVAAGYLLYGSSTMLVYSAGEGVHGFTLDPTVGEFLLSNPDIRIPDQPTYFSVNLGHRNYWSAGVQHFTDYLQGLDGQRQGLSLRYVGSLVADFHRTLLSGGIIYYPADTQDPQKPFGKLRLVYEAAPLAFLAEQAGGLGSDGHQNLLDVTPRTLHQRTPLFTGSKELVEKAEAFIRQYDR